ncbi:LuxR C-terminal-related transcriptional regulator [Microbacterium sp. NPDC090003]|uniref:helix-turn-helix transcriptional regulator n=1 Tax=Microbacterium sp. NPDC090003 TaxID=3364203 RepID=UPI0038244AC7
MKATTPSSTAGAPGSVGDVRSSERGQRVIADIHAALDEERWDDVGEILDDHFFALTLVGPRTLIEVWSRIPHEWVVKHPRRMLASALTDATHGSSDRLDEQIERAFTHWVLDQDHPAVRDTLSLHALEIRRSLVAGRFTRANDAADDAERAIDGLGDADAPVDLLGVVVLHIGLARLVVGDLVRAAAALAEAWRRTTEAAHPLAPYLAGYCALAHALAGDNVRATTWLDRGRVAFGDNSKVPTFRLQLAGLLARVLVSVGALDRDATADLLAQVARTAESGDLWWVGIHARARHALLWGDRARALREIEHALSSSPSLTPPSSLAGALLRADMSDIHQSLGDLDAALRVVAPLDRAGTHPYLAVSAARALMIRGRAAEASALLDRVEAQHRAGFIEAPRWRIIRGNLAYLARPTPTTKALIAGMGEAIASAGAADAAQEALPGLHRLLAEQAPCPDDKGARIVPPPMVSLTPREEQVLGLLAAHASVQKIAESMYVSRNTAKTHLRVLYRKLGVSSREAALQATAHLRR